MHFATIYYPISQLMIHHFLKKPQGLPMTPLLIFFLTSHSLLFSQANVVNSRETLEVVIGGGGFPPSSPPEYGDCPGCPPPVEPPVCPEPVPPPPPEPECPPPPPPPPPPEPECPPPPPPPPPPDFQLTPELRRAVKVIQRFKKTIGSDPHNITSTWNGQICKDKTKYKGFICDTTISDNKVRVALVKFNGFNFGGKKGQPLALRDFLEDLSDLIVFHVNTNNYVGQVPFGINQVPSLFELDLSNNKLNGAFPEAVLTATNLTFLDLRYNHITGKLHPGVFTLDLDVLYLNNNEFVGNIPENLGQTPSLYVTLANNFFTGEIPRSIGRGNTSNTLLEILLLNNTLSGCLPIEIGFLKKTYLFDASLNHLTGPIPHSFGCLKNLQYLNMSYNQLYGPVPEPLCMLNNLVTVTLTSNYFTQVGPACRKLIAKKKLDVGMNCILDLPSQRSPKECEAFFLKAPSCRDPASYNYMHCALESKGRRKLLAQPRTYEALEKDRPGPRITL